MSNDLLRLEDLVNNPTARVPVCLCLDTSGSMQGDPIRELNGGVRLFYDAIRDDETALYAAEICIVTFGNNGVECMADFAGLERQPTAPEMQASGLTPIGEAVNLGLDLLEKRKNEYKGKGIDYYQPWLVLMTDGRPEGSEPEELQRAMQRAADMANRRKLSIFPIGIGMNADMNVLAQFSPKRAPLKLQGLNFRAFFEWLSQSVVRTSQSTPGEKIQLDMDGIKSWVEL